MAAQNSSAEAGVWDGRRPPRGTVSAVVDLDLPTLQVECRENDGRTGEADGVLGWAGIGPEAWCLEWKLHQRAAYVQLACGLAWLVGLFIYFQFMYKWYKREAAFAS